METSLLLVIFVSAIMGFSAAIYVIFSFKKRIFKEKIDYLQTIYLFIVPSLLFIPLFYLFFSVLQRPNSGVIPISDLFITFLFFFIGMFGFIGLGIHTSSKCVYWHLKRYKETTAFKVNEFFHRRLSHHLIYYSGMLASLIFIIAEINHPVTSLIPSWNKYLLGFAGFIMGLSIAFSIICSGYWKSNLLFLFGVLLAVVSIFFKYSLNFHLLPLSIFFTSWVFTTFFVLLLFSLLTDKKNVERILGRYFID